MRLSGLCASSLLSAREHYDHGEREKQQGILADPRQLWCGTIRREHTDRPAAVKNAKTPKKVVKVPVKKKRVVKNYPKCSIPGCGKNRFPCGKGMCGEHYKQSLPIPTP